MKIKCAVVSSAALFESGRFDVQYHLGLLTENRLEAARAAEVRAAAAHRRAKNRLGALIEQHDAEQRAVAARVEAGTLRVIAESDSHLGSKKENAS
jgi:hypothetical protein